MRKFVCTAMIFCFLLTASLSVYAVPNLDNGDDAITQIYDFDGYPAFYWHTDEYTINAVLIEGACEVYYGNHLTNDVSKAWLSSNEVNASEEVIGDAAFWLGLAKKGAEKAEVVTVNMDAEDASLITQSVAGTQDTYHDWLDIMEAEFGPAEEEFSFWKSGGNAIAAVDIYEVHTYQFYDNGLTTCPAGATLQHCATLIGCAYGPLGDFLGLVFGECVSTQTNIYYVTISVNDVRQGRINGTAYYNVIHEVAYPAFDDVSGPRDPYVCFDEPEFDMYYDVDGEGTSYIYTSALSIIEKTTAIYAK